MDKFFDYLLANYILDDSRFPPHIWTDLNSENTRTTKCYEAFHSKFSAEYNAAHPNIYNVVEALKNVRTITYTKMRPQKLRTKKDNVQKKTELDAPIKDFTSGKIQNTSIVDSP